MFLDSNNSYKVANKLGIYGKKFEELGDIFTPNGILRFARDKINIECITIYSYLFTKILSLDALVDDDGLYIILNKKEIMEKLNISEHIISSSIKKLIEVELIYIKSSSNTIKVYVSYKNWFE